MLAVGVGRPRLSSDRRKALAALLENVGQETGRNLPAVELSLQHSDQPLGQDVFIRGPNNETRRFRIDVIYETGVWDFDIKNVFVHLESGPVDTGLKKLGAIVGEGAEVGCNAVLNPGTFLGRRSLVMPSIAFGGVLAAETIARVRQQVTLVPRKF